MNSPDTKTHSKRNFGLFQEISHWKEAFQHIPPNWYASVMGIGILANSTVLLPFTFPGQQLFATTVWALNFIWLFTLTLISAVHAGVNRHKARGYFTHPVFANFFGAVSMGILTVGSGTMLIGAEIMGEAEALKISLVLWFIGTIIGIAAAVWVPYLLICKKEVAKDAAFGGWLMPIVSPMVSAAAGAVLIPHIGSHESQLTMLLICYMFFGVTLMSALPIITMIWSNLIHHGPGKAGMVPTIWIILGPVGQSSTAIQSLGHQAGNLLPVPYGQTFEAIGLVYALPMMGFAILWLLIASLITINIARKHLPFGLTWWSFTFPVGTCVTGMSALATTTGSGVLSALSGALYLLLLVAVIVVGLRTFHSSVVTSSLLVE